MAFTSTPPKMTSEQTGHCAKDVLFQFPEYCRLARI